VLNITYVTKGMVVVYLQHMPKHGGGRLHDVQTFRASCDAGSKDSATAWITATKTLKSPDEVAYNSFAHVMEGLLAQGNGANEPVAIKLQTIGRLSNREATVAAYFRANPRRNIVVPICQFQCPHDLVKWQKPLPVRAGSRRLCDGTKGSDPMLSVLVLEYLPHNLVDYLVSQPVSDPVRVSILKQLGFTLIQLHLVDRMSHGDIGSGNMMLDVGEPRRNDYVIRGKTWSVDTHGVEPILIDFQLSTAFTGRVSRDVLVDEIALAYDLLLRWIHWDLAELIRKVDGSKTIDSLLLLIDGIV
jgi:hypothetical protein